MQLCQKYRPREFGDFIGQEKVIARIRAVIRRKGFGLGSGEAVWLSGPTGTGKTTLAEIISRELGVEPGPAWNYVEIDGTKCSVAEVRGLDSRTQAAGLFADSWQVFVVNEAHELQRRAVNAWLTLLERLPERWLVIFTTTQPADADLFGDFTEPLLSRCKVFEFTNQGLAKLFAARAREIAQAEGLDGKPESAYLRLAQESHNSMRKVLQEIDSGRMLA